MVETWAQTFHQQNHVAGNVSGIKLTITFIRLLNMGKENKLNGKMYQSIKSFY